jgi:hypothetical protein
MNSNKIIIKEEKTTIIMLDYRRNNMTSINLPTFCKVIYISVGRPHQCFSVLDRRIFLNAIIQ